MASATGMYWGHYGRSAQYNFTEKVNQEMKHPRCLGTTTKKKRCKRVGMDWCGTHLYQNWYAKSCSVGTCTRYRVSPKFCEVHLENTNHWIVMYYACTLNPRCAAFNRHLAAVGIFSTLADVEKYADEKVEGAIPNEVRGAEFSLVSPGKKRLDYLSLLTKNLSPLLSPLIDIVNDYIGKNCIRIECAQTIIGFRITTLTHHMKDPQTLSQNYITRSLRDEWGEVSRDQVHTIEVNKIFRLSDLLQR
uniref:Zn-finger protein n=1 Tax=Marseillevirus LCMAC103 TaxID=2506604 RepID=A0A481YUM2_9VIRU|nr:MAG: Zn-finger protein [Marseillevirus LCMAC103]